MLETKLICIEGIPGSGKSSTAQFLSRMLDELGCPNKWWYEEELGHPVYVYSDSDSVQQVVNDLTGGKYRDVIVKALNRWKQFAEYVASSDETIIIDGCLFGYLTWSLFPNNVAEAEITTYVREVEMIIKELNPCLIYFYQDDLNAALSKIMKRRGSDTEKFMIDGITQSHYGKTHGLTGFGGVVAYWQQYRKIIDNLYELLQVQKIAIENHEGHWPTYYHQITEFIGIEAAEQVPDSGPNLHNYAGAYSYTDQNGNVQICTVQWESGKLIVDGLPHVWKRTELLPIQGAFDVASLPLRIRFLSGSEDNNLELHLSGPALLNGTADCIATRISSG